MNIHLILLYVLAFANLFTIIHIGLFSVGANIYDLKKIKVAARKKKSRSTATPLVSVIVPAHNEELSIKRCLNSILSNTYPNIEVIVVNDDSSDNTTQVVKKYMRWMPRVGTKHYKPLRWQKRAINQRFLNNPISVRPVMLVNQARTGKGGALNNAIANYAHGKFVMCIDGDSMLQPDAIKNAVAYFKDPKIIGVAANVRIIDSRSWLSVMQKFEYMVGYRSKKFHTVMSSEFLIGGVASTYRMSVIKKVKFYDTDTMTEDIGFSMKVVNHFGNVSKKIVYASDVVALTGGVQSYKALVQQRYRWKMGNLQNIFKYRSLLFNNDSKYTRSLTTYRLPIAIVSEMFLLLEPVLIIYLIYLSITYHTLIVLIGGYVTMTLYVFLALWQDEHLDLFKKIKMSLYAIIIYALFYVMDTVQLSAIIRSLWGHRKIRGKQQTISTWSSPARSRQQVSV